MQSVPLKILIVDDHPIAQKGIQTIISTHKGYEVCGVLGQVNDVIPFMKTVHPDVIMLDLNFPDGSGTDILAELIGAYDMTVIIFSGDADTKNIQLCLNLGVRGIVSKADSGQDILAALDEVISGSLYLSPEVTKTLGDAPAHPIDLSPRQMAILHFMADGETNKEISYRLKIAAPTVSFHVGEIRKKLKVPNNKKILTRASALGLI